MKYLLFVVFWNPWYPGQFSLHQSTFQSLPACEHTIFLLKTSTAVMAAKKSDKNIKANFYCMPTQSIKYKKQHHHQREEVK